jgi:hypothetical protein
MRKQDKIVYLNIVEVPQISDPKLLGQHYYTIWGGCQILPQKLEAKTEV